LEFGGQTVWQETSQDLFAIKGKYRNDVKNCNADVAHHDIEQDIANDSGRDDFDYKTENNGQDEVGGRAGQGDQHRILLGISQVVGIKGDGFGPAEANKYNRESTEWIQVSQGIEGESAIAAGGGVPQFVGYVGMGEFVDGKGDDKGEGVDNEVHRWG